MTTLQNEDETFRILRRIPYHSMRELMYQKVWALIVPNRRLQNDEVIQLLLDNGWTRSEYLKAEKDYGDMS
jgi:hypothetical protein